MNIKTNPWTVPNYVTLKLPPGKRQDGFVPKVNGIGLADVDAETLARMCDEFRAEIFEKAGKRDPDVILRPTPDKEPTP